MKLFASTTSPYVRKVLIVAHEAGLAEHMERLPMAGSPINRDMSVAASNPLGQVPTLILDDGRVLSDSRVICEYLDDLGNLGLFPAERTARWKALSDQSLADGALVSLLLLRYETFLRPEALRWPEWVNGQWTKVRSVLAQFESEAGAFGQRFDIGLITLACVLSYIDLRTPEENWRQACPQLARWYEAASRRPSLAATALKA